MVKVTFIYDEASGKWATIVSGCLPTEARQAFNAVVITCRELDPALFNLHKVEMIEDVPQEPGVNRFRIVPAVSGYRHA